MASEQVRWPEARLEIDTTHRSVIGGCPVPIGEAWCGEAMSRGHEPMRLWGSARLCWSLLLSSGEPCWAME